MSRRESVWGHAPAPAADPAIDSCKLKPKLLPRDVVLLWNQFFAHGATMTFHRYLTIDAMRIFYREAGPPGAPVLLLLHGFPASSFMFRDLMAELSGQFRIV